MRKITIIIFYTFLHLNLFSQKKTLGLAIGPSYGLPISNKNFSYYYKNGIGGMFQMQYGLTKLGSITFNASNIYIGVKNDPVNKLYLMMVKTGYKTTFTNSNIFIQLDGGLAKYNSLKSRFVLGGSLGYSLRVSKKTYLDLFSTYNQILKTPSNSKWLNFNILFRMNIK